MQDLTSRTTAELLAMVSVPADQATFSAALVELIERYKNVVYYQAYRTLPGDPTLADDVFQDTFVRLFEWLKKRRGKPLLHSFPRLLQTFARRSATDILRKHRKGQIPVADIEAVSADLTDVFYAQEIMEWVDERSRKILELTFFGNYSAVEIGRLLKLTPGHVRTVRHRAIQQIRARQLEDSWCDSLESL